VKSPQRVQAGAAKAKRGLETKSLTAASTSGGNAREENQEIRVKNQDLYTPSQQSLHHR